MKKALIAMSGGVDSSVSALIMQNKGFECIGCTMTLHDNHNEDETDSQNRVSSDSNDAALVCQKLSMTHHSLDYRDEFKDKVIDNFTSCYLCGNTPNPCIECNEHLKFGKLHEKARELGCEYVVTGHYARIVYSDGSYHLLTAPDLTKDQSYVLYRLNQEQLSHTMFPLGEMSKEETRQIAESNGFINANKKDSQDICFVPDGDYVSVIQKYTDEKFVPGDFVDLNGNVLGQHKGIINYTIGQRKGLGIPAEHPYYVVRIDVPGNKVILGTNDDLFSDTLTATNAHWTQSQIPVDPFRATVRVRYHGKNVPATITPSNDTFSVKFDEPVRAITPGQAAVIYIDNEVIGGGTIV